jgi:hypothetical protein
MKASEVVNSIIDDVADEIEIPFERLCLLRDLVELQEEEAIFTLSNDLLADVIEDMSETRVDKDRLQQVMEKVNPREIREEVRRSLLGDDFLKSMFTDCVLNTIRAYLTELDEKVAAEQSAEDEAAEQAVAEPAEQKEEHHGHVSSRHR